MLSYVLLVVRAITGFVFIQKGLTKIIAGPVMWIWLGQKMVYFGITSNPLFWGLCCTFVELGGGILLSLGLAIRLTVLVLLCNMVIVFVYHINEAPTFTQMRLAIFITLNLIPLLYYGAGRYSLDYYIKTQCQSWRVMQWLCR